MTFRQKEPEQLGGIPQYTDKERMKDIEDMKQQSGVAVIGISRFRLGTDGKGITTLVAFHGCRLRCKYCLNKECQEPEEQFRHYTPQSLYDEVKADDLYFRATGGGITFGGGEPCIQADFIVAFRKICGPEWKIRVETSLNVESSLIDKLAPVVDEWIIDTKAERSVAYKRYTGVYRQQMMDNLYRLTSEERLNIPKSRIHLRVPIIPGLVSETQALESRKMFVDICGFHDIDVFRYVTREKHYNNQTPGRGKRVCKLLKDIRREIALSNGLNLHEHECSNQGECSGTCPVCEMEAETLMRQLKGKNLSLNYVTLARIKDFDSLDKSDDEGLGGIMIPEEDIPHPGEIESWKPEYKYKEVFFKECAVAGLSFHLEKDDELWNELEVGTKLALVRDRNNKHDSNAIAVALADDYDGNPDEFDFDFIIGYIPRSDNAELATMMDAGYADRFSARITAFKRYGSYNDRIRLTIFIRSNDPEIERPNLLRAHSISRSELKKMVDELDERGTVCFRWGGFDGCPPDELQSPAEGEKVVIVHRDENSEIIYLMRVLATGEECAKYVEDPDSTHCVDDCSPYILTNVMGPVRIKKSDWPFLSGADMCRFFATEYLPLRVSAGFKGIFRKQLMPTLNRDNIDMDPSIDNLI